MFSISCLNLTDDVVVPKTPLALIRTAIPDADVFPSIPKIVQDVCDEFPRTMALLAPTDALYPIAIEFVNEPTLASELYPRNVQFVYEVCAEPDRNPIAVLPLDPVCADNALEPIAQLLLPVFSAFKAEAPNAQFEEPLVNAAPEFEPTAVLELAPF